MKFSWTRASNYYKRMAARYVFKRTLVIRTQRPLISFTFDDFPRSALAVGGAILNHYGISGTYYVSLGMLGEDSVSGKLCALVDLKVLLAQGHELGCHTFTHCDSWDTAPSIFEDAIHQNRRALEDLIPDAEFKSFSYPLSEPRPTNKRRASKHFLCCRGGGQSLNVGSTDLNQLSAFFLEKKRDSISEIKDLIDRNRALCGWAIFATHDVAESPSPYGCSPGFFEEVVRYAVDSGSLILPIVRAMDVIGGVKVAHNHSGLAND